MRLNFRVSTAAGLMPNYHTPISHKLIPLFLTGALLVECDRPVLLAGARHVQFQLSCRRPRGPDRISGTYRRCVSHRRPGEYFGGGRAGIPMDRDGAGCHWRCGVAGPSAKNGLMGNHRRKNEGEERT